MKQIIGYTCFVLAIGMLLAVFIRYSLIALIFIILLLIVGYNLFCC